MGALAPPSCMPGGPQVAGLRAEGAEKTLDPMAAVQEAVQMTADVQETVLVGDLVAMEVALLPHQKIRAVQAARSNLLVSASAVAEGEMRRCMVLAEAAEGKRRRFASKWHQGHQRILPAMSARDA